MTELSRFCFFKSCIISRPLAAEKISLKEAVASRGGGTSDKVDQSHKFCASCLPEIDRVRLLGLLVPWWLAPFTPHRLEDAG